VREKLFNLLSSLHARHTGKMLLAVALLSLLSLFFALQLDQTMRWSDLLPGDDPRTVEFDKVIREFVSSSSIIVVVEGKEEDIKNFAEAVVPGIEALEDSQERSFVQRVNYKKEVGFIREHGLMMIKSEYLENIKGFFESASLPGLIENMNDSLEKEYVGKQESLSTREKEDRAVNLLDGLKVFLGTIERSVLMGSISEEMAMNASDMLLVGDPYILSYDKEALILDVVPNFSMIEMERLLPGVKAVKGVVHKTLEDFPNVTAGLTGTPVIQHDEMVYTTRSLGYTSLIALITIFILLAVAFRMAVAPAFAIANLVIGIIWAMGAAFLVVGSLNLMTSMTGVVLIGLGIDFSIHLISAFTEERSLGLPIEKSLNNSFLKCGKGIITGGLTTSAAFMTLAISSTRGMREMGIVMGTGLICVMLVTLLLLPSLLVFREKIREKRSEKNSFSKESKDISFSILGRAASSLKSYPLTVLGLILIFTALMVWSGRNISFDHNYMNLEPKGLTSVELYDTVLDKFDFSIDYSLFIARSLEESAELAEEARELPSVAMVEDISIYLPSVKEQGKRLGYVQDIVGAMKDSELYGLREPEDMKTLLAELERLEMNVMEMQDLAFLGGQDKVDSKCAELVGYPGETGSKTIFSSILNSIEDDPSGAFNGLQDMERAFSPYFRNSVINMGAMKTLGIQDLPESILNRYSNRTRDSFLVTVYPIRDIWQDARFLDLFVKDLERVSPRATGMPPVFRALIKIMGRDGRNAVILTVLVVFLLLALDFRNVFYAFLAMVPLGAGLVWMVGLMNLLGTKLTVINIMALPLILGIGIDDGVYIMHRWIREGKKDLYAVFASTGKAILLTSLTDMLAFGSLVFSIYRGFAGFGWAMFLGVGACFITTVVILSPILGKIGKSDNHENPAE